MLLSAELDVWYEEIRLLLEFLRALERSELKNGMLGKGLFLVEEA